MIWVNTSCTGQSLTPNAIREFAAMLSYIRVGWAETMKQMNEAIELGNGVAARPQKEHFEKMDACIRYLGSMLQNEFDLTLLEVCRMYTDALIRQIDSKSGFQLTASPPEIERVLDILSRCQNPALNIRDGDEIGGAPIPLVHHSDTGLATTESREPRGAPLTGRQGDNTPMDRRSGSKRKTRAKNK